MTSTASNDQIDLLPPPQKTVRVGSGWFANCCKPSKPSQHANDVVMEKEEDLVTENDTIEDMPNMDILSEQEYEEVEATRVEDRDLVNATNPLRDAPLLLVGFIKMLWAFLLVEAMGKKTSNKNRIS